MKILITGGNGFVAQNLCSFLKTSGHEVITSTRTEQETGCKNFIVGQLTEATNWNDALEGVDCVIHLAARVHVMKEPSKDPLGEFMRANCYATKKLAESSMNKGVKKFIFISSIGVNGEVTTSQGFSEEDLPHPNNPYAISKLEAEKTLTAMCKDMELIIIRPPLIYGPNCKGNFDSLIKLCKIPIPLPFALCNRNKRNLLYIENFSHFIVNCLEKPGKTGVYLVADNESLSIAEIIKNIRTYLGIRPLLFPIPFLNKILSFIGKENLNVKLLSSLEISTQKCKEDFSWNPPYTAKEGFKRTIEGTLLRKI